MNTKALRSKILDLAIHGKLLSEKEAAECRKGETATELLEKIRKEKEDKIAKGELKSDKKSSYIFVGDDRRHYEKFQDGAVKCVEDEIPFEVPDGWAWCRLGEICDLKGGKRIPAGKFATTENTGHIYIRVTDMQNDSISDKDIRYITDDIYEMIKNYTISKDDLYLTIAGTIGRVGEVPAKFDGHNLTENALKLTNINIIKKFLMYILKSDSIQAYFESTYHQVAMPKLSLINASKTFIPLPPLAEQKAIVAKIEEIFSQIDILENNKTDLQTTIKHTKLKILDLAIHGKLVPQNPNDEPASKLLEKNHSKCEFGEGKLGKCSEGTRHKRRYPRLEDVPFDVPDNWVWCKLGEFVDILNGFPFESDLFSSDPKNRRPLIRIRDILRGYTKTFTNEKCPDVYIIHKGDMLIGMDGDFNIGYWNSDDGLLNQRVCKICSNSKYVLNEYLFFYLPTPLSDINSKTSSVTVKHLSSKTICDILFPLPPLAEQKRIVETIESLFSILDQITENLS